MTAQTQSPSNTLMQTTSSSAANTRNTLAKLSPVDPVKVATRHAQPDRPGVLISDRLVLRPLCEHDRQAFITLIEQSRDHLERFSPLHMLDESDDGLFERQLALTQAGEASGKACRQIVCDQSGRIIGACNINAIRRGLSVEGDANWWLAPSATGQGYATEALSLLLDYAFADMPDGLGLHRVLAGIQEQNTSSRALALRLGFLPLGDEKTYLHAGEKWDLHEMFAVTPESMSAALGGS